jgi:hypothetical protein
MWALIYQPLLYCYIIGSTVLPLKHKMMHPIHVSTTSIEYNKQDNKVEVICTIFTDDFEAALVKQYSKKTDLNRADMHTAMDVLVKSYINSHLQLKTGTQAMKLNYVGFEINKEATDVYFESDKTAVFKKIDIDDSLLYNLFDDQINIVHVIVNGVRKSEKLDYPNTKLSQEF